MEKKAFENIFVENSKGNISNKDKTITGVDRNCKKSSLLLHSCCGPCSTAVIERLIPDYDITVFFFNPCITDNEEYELRKENQIKFIEEYNKKNLIGEKVKFIEGRYDPKEYFQKASVYADELEGGKRCTVCFEQRLEETAKVASENKYDLFATTLTVSPHKNYPLISEIGRKYSEKYNVVFLDMDFKKKAGFQRSVQLSKEYGLYRQNYCGCIYSKRNNQQGDK